VKTSLYTANRPGRCGFTLIELLIVITVIGILALMAYPTYLESVTKTRRADAKVALSELANALERYYYNNGNYNATVGGGTGIYPDTSAEGYYQIRFIDSSSNAVTTNDQGNTYEIRAIPLSSGPQAGDTECASFTLTSSGTQGVTGTKSATNCW